jgi:hypothetical protein
LDNFPEEEDDVWHIKEKLYKVRTTGNNPLFFLLLSFYAIPWGPCSGAN